MNTWQQQFSPAGQTRDCVHGHLARSCNVCELEHEVFDLQAELTQLREVCDELALITTCFQEHTELINTFAIVGDRHNAFKALTNYSTLPHVIIAKGNKQ